MGIIFLAEREFARFAPPSPLIKRHCSARAHKGAVMVKIALIGSTGSIGRQAIEVALARPDMFRIVALAANSSYKLFSRQLAQVRPDYAALANEEAAKKTEVPKNTRFCAGEEGALRAAEFGEADVVLVAASGFAGLKYSLAALRAGKTLALANKETLVCGGDIVMPLASRMGADIRPVDSEHSAIWQCLGCDLHAPFKRLIITASGGPFKNFTPEQLKGVTPAMALAHPTWNMGAKITVDSATMLNKGFEIIEAHHLFGAEYDKITALIHPQSIVHSMVELCDGAILAQLSHPTMKLPIQLALTAPRRTGMSGAGLDISKALTLEFSPVQKGTFPCFDLACSCARAGGILPCALNAAGEVAVHAFLAGGIKLTDIYSVIARVTEGFAAEEVQSYEQLCNIDALARVRAEEAIRSL